MSDSLRLKGTFLGCAVGLALVTRLAFAGSIGLFGPMGGLADFASELSILIGVLATCGLIDRFTRYYDNRARRQVLEEGFVKWIGELEAQKSAAMLVSTVKKAA
jgi:hypothetical protein